MALYLWNPRWRYRAQIAINTPSRKSFRNKVNMGNECKRSTHALRTKKLNVPKHFYPCSFASPAPFLCKDSSYLWDLSGILCVSKSSLQQGSIAKSVFFLGESEKEGAWACVLGAKGREWKGNHRLQNIQNSDFLFCNFSLPVYYVIPCHYIFFVIIIFIGPLFHVIFSLNLRRPCANFE